MVMTSNRQLPVADQVPPRTEEAMCHGIRELDGRSSIHAVAIANFSCLEAW